MSEDEQLLMLAAKAEGREPPIDASGVWSAWVGSPVSGHWWNPLEDDGDALRLAMKLRMTVEQSMFEIKSSAFIPQRTTRSFSIRSAETSLETRQLVAPSSLLLLRLPKPPRNTPLTPPPKQSTASAGASPLHGGVWSPALASG